MNKIISKIEKFILLTFRNRIILTMMNYPAKKKRVNLNWAPICTWSKTKNISYRSDSAKQNLGDYLANPILDYMVKTNNIDRDKKVSGTKHLYTIGSIINMGYQDATVWGSGLLRQEPEGYIWNRNKYRKLDIRCVRGPETKRRLEENGYDVSHCVLGDPGVLMPLVYQPKEFEEKKEYSVILHMNKKNAQIANQIDIMTSDWKKTIDEIYNSKLIISSSLHGIILAEAYGIPAVLYGKVEHADMFKYNDYYYSTGRHQYPACYSIEEALNTEPAPLPDLSQLQRNLLESFPKDLWEMD